jgi:elongation factor 1 alpha-like protein
MDTALRAALDARPPTKESLHVVVLGHVDAGKSTLMGRMIADLGFVDERTVRKTMAEAQAAGRGSFGWAWAFDERPEEREHGVTIDVSTRHIETDKCAPGLWDSAVNCCDRVS